MKLCLKIVLMYVTLVAPSPFSMWCSTRYVRLTMFSPLIPEVPDNLQSIRWLGAKSSESDVAATGNQWTVTHGPRSKTHHINLRKSKPWTHVSATRLKKSLINPSMWKQARLPFTAAISPAIVGNYADVSSKMVRAAVQAGTALLVSGHG